MQSRIQRGSVNKKADNGTLDGEIKTISCSPPASGISVHLQATISVTAVPAGLTVLPIRCPSGGQSPKQEYKLRKVRLALANSPRQPTTYEPVKRIAPTRFWWIHIFMIRSLSQRRAIKFARASFYSDCSAQVGSAFS